MVTVQAVAFSWVFQGGQRGRPGVKPVCARGPGCTIIYVQSDVLTASVAVSARAGNGEE